MPEPRFLVVVSALLLWACNEGALPPAVDLGGADSSSSGCAKDTDCKGERICVDGRCVDPGWADLGPGSAPDGAACGSGAAWAGFADRVDYATAVDPQWLAIGDFNGDKHTDVAVTTLSGGLNVLANKGTGTFAAHVDYGIGKGTSVAVGDLNGDGKTDVVVVNSGGMASLGGSNTISVFLNKGNGALAAPVDYATGVGPRSVAVADLNGDGRLDLVVANVADNSVSVLLNQGAGTFAARVDYLTGPSPWALAVGDLDGNEKPDLAVVNYGAMGGGGTVSILRNQGNGTFGAAANYATGIQPVAVAIADLDNDGKADLAVANDGGDSVSVLLNKGNASFAVHVDYGVGPNPSSVAIGDLDGDGKPDLALTNSDHGTSNPGTVTVLLNHGNGAFAARTDHPVGRAPSAVAIGDYDGDGTLDLAVANYSSSTVSILLNQGCH